MARISQRAMIEATVEAMRLPKTREALRRDAERVRSRAEQIAASEGVELEASIREGTRPRGRPFANVESRNVGQEFGDRYTERRRILGRAADGH